MTKKRKDALIPAIITAITVLAVTAAVIVLTAGPSSVEAQGSDAVHVITGKATVNGAPARIGAIVTAYLDGRMVISSTVTGARGEFRPLTVTGPGGEVSFRIDGDMAGELVEWSDGGTTIQDLSVGSDQAAGTAPGSMPGQGPPGRRGIQGETGPRGETGKRGEEGEQGNRGVRGPRGYPGADGAEGPPGPEAADGLNGMDGFHGSEGPTGPTGSSGKGLAVLSLIMSFLTLSGMGGLAYLMWKRGMLKGIAGRE